MKNTGYILVSVLALFSVFEAKSQNTGKPEGKIRVTAAVETTPMAVPGDAADDPAIWIHPTDPAKSTIIGTNKKQGIYVYNLQGEILYEYPSGRINNIDIRYGFPLGDQNIDILAGSNRSDTSVIVLGVNPVNGSLFQVLDLPIRSGLTEVYGLCLYHDIHSGRFFVFVNGTDGKVEQWELLPTAQGKVSGRLARTFAMKSQTEGCVADDETGIFYIGEEDYGIWKMKADPGTTAEPILVDSVKNRHLKKDIEGLALYYARDGRGYLIASSQGSNTYAVYSREGKNEYLGSFSVVKGKDIDGTEETDGIDVTGASLGPAYLSGFFIAQDGRNKGKGKTPNQNFKIVPWEKIASGFNPPLVLDTVTTKRILSSP